MQRLLTASFSTGCFVFGRNVRAGMYQQTNHFLVAVLGGIHQWGLSPRHFQVVARVNDCALRKHLSNLGEVIVMSRI
jgi:hypothetical protein